MPLTPWFDPHTESSAEEAVPHSETALRQSNSLRRKRTLRWTLTGSEMAGSDAQSLPRRDFAQGEAPLSPTARSAPHADSPEEDSHLRHGGRRGLNIGVALAGIVLTAPLMVIIAVLVKLTSRGPVLYVQPRVGLDRRDSDGRADLDPRRKEDLGGRIFRIYKFRTMTHTPEREADQVWAAPDDPRVTPLGRILRDFRLDELPQFFNVLKGDMNIVGPRPEQPAIFQGLRKEIDEYPVRQKVLPGITGLAQVNSGYDHSLDDVKVKVSLDLEYVQRVSTLEDLRIMARTIPVMLFRRGAR